jgi:hypothetical protein
MNAIENTALLAELTPEESATINGGDATSNFIASSLFGIGDPFVGYQLWDLSNQYVYPAVSNFLTSNFLYGGSMYDGMNAVQSLVNWASSPI